MKLLLTILAAGIVLFPAGVQASSFSDADGHWASSAVETWSSEGVITGYPDGTFQPEREVSRSESAYIFGRYLGTGGEITTTHRFEDVDTSRNDAPFVYGLVEEGIFAADTRFRPDDELTRAEMAKILVEGLDIQSSSSSSFTDVPDSHWASDYISILASEGIAAGTEAGRFSPDEPVTRAQTAVFLDRAVNGTAIGGETPLYNAEVEAVIEGTNAEREAAGLEPLGRDRAVEATAMKKAEDFHVNNYFAHESPEYGSPFDMLQADGIEYQSAGENIARGYQDPQTAVDAWMNSTGHRENILKSDYTHIGVGYYEENGERYYVQMFIQK
ncbi:S-layer homology domain-containing protein [Alkalicoccus urumqiensis]|uniref:SLH domain-containing protein n=1 Tax=Alkalicoccus urumqiensis TaxID=1548213 RepID=A0A2P6ML97_ALKUR|nr:S-layer homology domain-containing protein [Alkalicoccus urumqiensis]PRO67052.1 hypothetical protein C6I21_00350 [Alkalicoccus urumqiensis]